MNVMSLVGDLELRVINALKNIHEGTIRQILKEIERTAEENETIPAYTTVATVLSRLAEKHQVQFREARFRKNQKILIYIYEDVEENYIKEMLDRLTITFGEQAVVRLAEHIEEKLKGVDPERVTLLRKKINEKMADEV